MHLLIITLCIITPIIAFAAWVVTGPDTDIFCNAVDAANELTESEPLENDLENEYAKN